MRSNVPDICRRVMKEMEELDFALASPRLPAMAAEHLETCPQCMELYRLLSHEGQRETAALPLELRERIESALLPTLKPVRRAPPQIASALIFLIAFAVLAFLLVSATQKGGLRAMDATQMAVMTTLLAIPAILLSFSLAWQMIPGSYRRFSAKSLLSGSYLALLAAAALLFPWNASSASFASGWRCSATELLIAMPSAALFWLLLRRGAPHAGYVLGASLAGFSSLLAVAVLQFQCPLQQAPHLLIWHLGVPLLLVPAGMLLAHAIQLRTAS